MPRLRQNLIFLFCMPRNFLSEKTMETVWRFKKHFDLCPITAGSVVKDLKE